MTLPLKARPMTYGKSKRAVRTHTHVARSAQFSEDEGDSHNEEGHQDGIKSAEAPSGLPPSGSKSSVASSASSKSTTRRAPLSEKDPNKPRSVQTCPTAKVKRRSQKKTVKHVSQPAKLRQDIDSIIPRASDAIEQRKETVQSDIEGPDSDPSFSIIVPPARRFGRQGGTYGRQLQSGFRRRIVITSDTSESEAGSSHEKDDDDEGTEADTDASAKSLQCFVEVPPTPDRRILQSRNARAAEVRRRTSLLPGQAATEQLSDHLNTLQLESGISSSSIDQDHLARLLHVCHQDEPGSFAEALAPLGFHSRNRHRIEKAGEASYSEVFRLRGSKKSNTAAILKVIPLQGNGTATNGSLASDVYREVAMTENLARDSNEDAPGFITLHSATIVKGAYPTHLIHAWDAFSRREEGDVDPRTYTDDQLFGLLHLSDGGVDLENLVLQGWHENLAILTQVVDVLATAETRSSFEHRDLHWGNIVIQRQRRASERLDSLTWDDLCTPRKSGLRTQLIDFTLSRMTITDNETLSFDLNSEPTLFEGDATDEYQYEVYRLMRSHLRIQSDGDADWSRFAPGTNIIWLHYVTKKLLEEKAPLALRKKCTKNPVDDTAHSRLVALEDLLAKQVKHLSTSTAATAGKTGRPRRRNVSAAVGDEEKQQLIGSAVELRAWCQRAWE